MNNFRLLLPTAETMEDLSLHVLLLHFVTLLCTLPASGQIAFPEEPVNTTVLQNGRVSLRCVAVDTHLQRAHTSWRQSADGSLSNRFHFDPASGTLSLPLVQCDDAGWYTCVASDGSETAERTVYLTVLCGTAPSFVRSLPPNHSFTNVQSLGDTAVVQCSARGDPPPDIRWEKEGVRLPSGPSAEGPYVSGGTLHLASSLPRDSGVYHCVAENRLGTVVQSTTVTIVAEVPPLWLSWWMLSLYCAVVIVVLLGVPLCIKLAVVGYHKRKDQLGEVQSCGSEGVVGKRSATAWLSESASKGSPKRVQTAAVSERVESTSIDDETAEVVMDEVVGTNDESLAGPERENRAAPPFGIEVVKATTFFRPMTWCEYWDQQGYVQQEDTHAMGRALAGDGQKHSQSPRRHTYHSKQKRTGVERQPDDQHETPRRKAHSRASKAEKIRKSEGKDFVRHWGTPHMDQSADSPVDMKLQLVEVGDDEDDNIVSNPLFSEPNGPLDTSFTSNVQTEDTLLDDDSSSVAMEDTGSPAPQVPQLSGRTEQGSTTLADSMRTSLSPVPSFVASLGSMSPTESQIDLQTDRAFAFLDEYGFTSDLAEEDGWGQGEESAPGTSGHKGDITPYRT